MPNSIRNEELPVVNNDQDDNVPFMHFAYMIPPPLPPPQWFRPTRRTPPMNPDQLQQQPVRNPAGPAPPAEPTPPARPTPPPKSYQRAGSTLYPTQMIPYVEPEMEDLFDWVEADLINEALEYCHRKEVITADPEDVTICEADTSNLNSELCDDGLYLAATCWKGPTFLESYRRIYDDV